MNITYTNLLRACCLPRLEARLLLQKVSKFSHAGLISNAERNVPLCQQNEFMRLVEQRKNGRPIAYLLGYREFYSRLFMLSEQVLIPRPETEHLVEAALSYLDNKAPLRVLDLGTGSGILAITLALEAKSWQLYASDASANALNIAKQNAHALGAKVNFYQGDWFAALPTNSQRFDLIISNPPYIASDDEHLELGDLVFEPKSALTDFADGLSCLRTIIANANKYLNAGGYLMLEHGYQQGACVRELLSRAKFSQIETLCDLAALERISLGRY